MWQKYVALVTLISVLSASKSHRRAQKSTLSEQNLAKIYPNKRLRYQWENVMPKDWNWQSVPHEISTIADSEIPSDSVWEWLIDWLIHSFIHWVKVHLAFSTQQVRITLSNFQFHGACCVQIEMACSLEEKFTLVLLVLFPVCRPTSWSA